MGADLMAPGTSLRDRVAEWAGSTRASVEADGRGPVGFAVAGDGGRLDGWIEANDDPAQIIVRLGGPWEVPPDRFTEAAEVIARINCALEVGNVELSSTGDWRARAGIALGAATLDRETLAILLQAGVDACLHALQITLEPLSAAIDGDEPGPLP
jgi:Putative bacterial sensory transduction regulator